MQDLMNFDSREKEGEEEGLNERGREKVIAARMCKIRILAFMRVTEELDTEQYGHMLCDVHFCALTLVFLFLCSQFELFSRRTTSGDQKHLMPTLLCKTQSALTSMSI